MKMNRRNVLVGLGTIVAGGGAALGTGAFSSVEADRTVSVGIAGGDAGALLGLDASQDSNFVTDGGDGDTLEIEIPDVNPDATTTIDPAFSITNNSGDGDENGDEGQSMKIWAEADNNDNDVGDIVQFNVGSDPNVEDGGDILVEEGQDNPENLELAEDTDSIDAKIVIETSNNSTLSDVAELLNEVTFYAEGEN